MQRRRTLQASVRGIPSEVICGAPHAAVLEDSLHKPPPLELPYEEESVTEQTSCDEDVEEYVTVVEEEVLVDEEEIVEEEEVVLLLDEEDGSLVEVEEEVTVDEDENEATTLEETIHNSSEEEEEGFSTGTLDTFALLEQKRHRRRPTHYSLEAPSVQSHASSVTWYEGSHVEEVTVATPDAVTLDDDDAATNSYHSRSVLY